MLLPFWQWVTIYILHNGESGSHWEENSLLLVTVWPQQDSQCKRLDDTNLYGYGKTIKYNFDCAAQTLFLLLFFKRLKRHGCPSPVFNNPLLHPAQGGGGPDKQMTPLHTAQNHTFHNYFTKVISHLVRTQRSIFQKSRKRGRWIRDEESLSTHQSFGRVLWFS